MKKSWLQSQSICMAMGDAVAKNLMFETKEDHEIFLNYWNKYLGKMASLINYHLSPTGWVLLFKTKSTHEIKSAYLNLRKKSKKANKKHTLHDSSKMLSEHFRIFLSQYVRRTNAIHGRRGSKVMCRFHRYILKDDIDFVHLFNLITGQQRKQAQKKIKYIADEHEYDVQQEMSHDSIWKVGSRLYMGLEKEFKVRFGVLLLKPNNPVLRKYLNPTHPLNPNSHFT